MSLSVPYVLAACVDVAPDATVAVDGHRNPVRDVDLRTVAEAQRLLEDGMRPGGHHDMDATCESPAIRHLAIARIGAVLCGEPSCPDRTRARDADVPGVDVLETRVWSAVPLLHTAGSVVTHGDYLDALGAPELADVPGPRALAVLVDDLLAVGRAAQRR